MRLQCNPPNTTHDLDLLEPELWHRRASGPFQWSLTVWCIVADGSPMSWWLDREGERRSYWGGFLPGVQQCSCSLEENCVDMNYFCNCDADTDAWYVSQTRNSFFYNIFLFKKRDASVIHPCIIKGYTSLYNAIHFNSTTNYVLHNDHTVTHSIPILI